MSRFIWKETLPFINPTSRFSRPAPPRRAATSPPRRRFSCPPVASPVRPPLRHFSVPAPARPAPPLSSPDSTHISCLVSSPPSSTREEAQNPKSITATPTRLRFTTTDVSAAFSVHHFGREI